MSDQGGEPSGLGVLLDCDRAPASGVGPNAVVIAAGRKKLCQAAQINPHDTISWLARRLASMNH